MLNRKEPVLESASKNSPNLEALLYAQPDHVATPKEARYTWKFQKRQTTPYIHPIPNKTHPMTMPHAAGKNIFRITGGIKVMSQEVSFEVCHAEK